MKKEILNEDEKIWIKKHRIDKIKAIHMSDKHQPGIEIYFTYLSLNCVFLCTFVYFVLLELCILYVCELCILYVSPIWGHWSATYLWGSKCLSSCPEMSPLILSTVCAAFPLVLHKSVCFITWQCILVDTVTYKAMQGVTTHSLKIVWCVLWKYTLHFLKIHFTFCENTLCILWKYTEMEKHEKIARTQILSKK